MRSAFCSLVLLCSSAAAQSPCSGPLNDPSVMSYYFGHPCWSTIGNTILFDGLAAGLSYFPCSWGSSARLNVGMIFTFGQTGDGAGILLGYEPGDHDNPNADYLGLVWGPAFGAPMQLMRFTGPLTANGFPQASQVLAVSDVGRNVTIDLEVTMSDSAIVIKDGNTHLLSAPGDFSAYTGNGRAALVSWNQDMTWHDVSMNATVTPGSAMTFGQSCAGSAGTPTLRLVGEPPHIGRSVLITVGGGDSSNVLIGFGATPLNPPVDLTPVGATNCTVLIDPVASILANPTSPTTAEIQFVTPNNAGLVGLTLVLQSVLADPSANPAGIVTTNGLAIQVGG